jgi:hypothetical protein
MQYLGGKADVGKAIAQIIGKRRCPGALFVDMFCGSLNVIRHVPSKVPLAAGGLVESPRTAIDACGPLIVMWRVALTGWVPPKVVTAAEYAAIKATQDPHDPMTAFVLFGCSFGDPRTPHSVKPDSFYALIEECSPGPYLELFSRRRRTGWSVWGNEVESDVQLGTAEYVDDEWTERIKAAHPTRSGSHDEYGIAMRMVGHRHSKGELVALVNWLLVQGGPAHR